MAERQWRTHGWHGLKATCLFLYGWFSILLQWLVPQFNCTQNYVALSKAYYAVLCLSKCYAAVNVPVPQVRISATVKVSFHAPLTTYFTSGDAHFYDRAWNGTSDMLVHILGTLKLQHCTANQSCSVAFSTALLPLHWALGKWTVHLYLHCLSVSIM